mgnify:CR=1 FL=1
MISPTTIASPIISPFLFNHVPPTLPSLCLGVSQSVAVSEALERCLERACALHRLSVCFRPPSRRYQLNGSVCLDGGGQVPWESKEPKGLRLIRSFTDPAAKDTRSSRVTASSYFHAKPLPA